MLLEKAIAAHGGLQRWQQIEQLKIISKVGGNILMSKFQSTRWRYMESTVDTHRFLIKFFPFSQPTLTGCFDGNRVTLLDQNGAVIKSRDIIRDANGDVINRFIWDELDLLYFLGYALWNYFVTPFVFLSPGFDCQELSPWQESDNVYWQRLKVVYPKAFPTHCREQIFYFNDQSLLTRLDYTADVFSRVARGAHYCYDHKNFGGLMIPTHRVAYLRRGNNRPLPFFPAMEGWIKDVIVQEKGKEKIG